MSLYHKIKRESAVFESKSFHTVYNCCHLWSNNNNNNNNKKTITLLLNKVINYDVILITKCFFSPTFRVLSLRSTLLSNRRLVGSHVEANDFLLAISEVFLHAFLEILANYWVGSILDKNIGKKTKSLLDIWMLAWSLSLLHNWFNDL